MILYLLKSACCMALFLGLYHLLLEKEKAHLFKRLYLLASLIASLCIPLLIVDTQYIEISTTHIQTGNSISVVSPYAIPVPSMWNAQSILLGVYIIGLVIMLIRFVGNIWKIRQLIRRNPLQPISGAQLILHEQTPIAFSFLNYIFLNRDAYKSEEEGKLLIAHEMAHVSQKHSWDILLVEGIHCLYWFNPLIILFKKALRLNHEYLADSAVIRQTENPAAYMHLLISLAARDLSPHMTTSLNYGKTQKRLNMMTSPSPNTYLSLRQLIIFAASILVILSFGRTQIIPQAPLKTLSSTPGEPTVDTADIQFELNAFDGGMIAYEVMKEGQSYRGHRMVFEENGKRVQWKVYALIDGNARVSFMNPDGERIEKRAKSLNEEERKWFWQLEQSNAQVYRMPTTINFPKPTKAQLADFLNPREYGVWMDGVRIQNTELKNYKAEDFQSVFVSRLERNAAHYGRYNFQVNLETKKSFDAKYAGKKEGWWEEVKL